MKKEIDERNRDISDSTKLLKELEQMDEKKKTN